MVKQAFLVDDSKSARIVLSRLLKKNGFDQVDMAESGEAALEQLKTITPDAIFVDFLMDGIDGLETINEIKKDPRFESTPVVMCTANEGDEYVRAAVDHGALGILAKPPTDQSLGEIIELIERHQREVSAKAQPAAAVAAPRKIAPVESAVAKATGEVEVRRIATDFSSEKLVEIATRKAAQVAEERVTRLLAERVEKSVNGFLESRLQAMIEPLVERRLAEVKPPEIDTNSLRDQVVRQVNAELTEFVRQLNQRTVEGLIEASIHEQITELANDFAQRLSDVENRILEQVPEKNEMIEHIRVVTEGSLEAQVRETATHVAQEISNSVATETVETLLEQQLTSHPAKQESSSSALGWIITLLLLVAAGAGAYLYLLQ